MSTAVKAKAKCCKDKPRCKRCPVVLKRLEAVGLAERKGKRAYRLPAPVGKQAMKAARG